MTERTLAIIKPDAVQARVSGLIIEIIELNKFEILKLEKRTLTKAQAEQFYDIHKDKAFFGELVNYMVSAPVILAVLEKENAVLDWRDLMGPTDPKNAPAGTMRRMFGTSIGSNATHGSDSSDNAKKEISLFFPSL